MCTRQLTAPSPARARKLRGLLLAYLALDDDAAGIACSHVKGRTFGHAAPVIKHGTCGFCHGAGCPRCKRGVIEYRELDAYVGDVEPASLPPARESSVASFGESVTERAAVALMRRRAALGSTVPHLERALKRMRADRPDLYAHVSSATDEVVAWLSHALTGQPIVCPRWARSNA